VTTADPKAVTLSPGLITTSAAEVERVLEALLVRREPLAALLGGGASSQWRLHFVDPARQYILVEPASSDPAAGAALLARERVTFLAAFGGMHIEFTADAPRQESGVSDLRFDFPAATVSHQRRAHRRAPVPPGFPLNCVIPAGAGVALEGQIMDISEGGIGLVVHGAYLVPAPGTLIRGWQIERPGKSSIRVDLEVRHCRPLSHSDGSQAQRWGCQFLNPSDEVKELIVAFAGK
jgi:c-di-GMP-binding flagellar brake protein YcgR